MASLEPPPKSLLHAPPEPVSPPEVVALEVITGASTGTGSHETSPLA
jgi:hypothetical protein